VEWSYSPAGNGAPPPPLPGRFGLGTPRHAPDKPHTSQCAPREARMACSQAPRAAAASTSLLLSCPSSRRLGADRPRPPHRVADPVSRPPARVAARRLPVASASGTEPATAHARNIVVAVDSSDEALFAFEWALENLYRPGTDSVHLLHVVPDVFNSPASGSIYYPMAIDHEVERALVSRRPRQLGAAPLAPDSAPRHPVPHRRSDTTKDPHNSRPLPRPPHPRLRSGARLRSLLRTSLWAPPGSAASTSRWCWSRSPATRASRAQCAARRRSCR
jgi:hypothetical protein